MVHVRFLLVWDQGCTCLEHPYPMWLQKVTDLTVDTLSKISYSSLYIKPPIDVGQEINLRKGIQTIDGLQ